MKKSDDDDDDLPATGVPNTSTSTDGTLWTGITSGPNYIEICLKCTHYNPILETNMYKNYRYSFRNKLTTIPGVSRNPISINYTCQNTPKGDTVDKKAVHIDNDVDLPFILIITEKSLGPSIAIRHLCGQVSTARTLLSRHTTGKLISIR